MLLKCPNHPDVEAEVECEKCGRHFCFKCVVVIGRMHYCKLCAEKERGIVAYGNGFIMMEAPERRLSIRSGIVMAILAIVLIIVLAVHDGLTWLRGLWRRIFRRD